MERSGPSVGGGRVNPAPDDRVTCEICQRHFRKITNTHLRTHGMTVPEYREKYPHAPVSAEAILQKERAAGAKGGRSRSERKIAAARQSFRKCCKVGQLRRILQAKTRPDRIEAPWQIGPETLIYHALIAAGFKQGQDFYWRRLVEAADRFIQVTFEIPAHNVVILVRPSDRKHAISDESLRYHRKLLSQQGKMVHLIRDSNADLQRGKHSEEYEVLVNWIRSLTTSKIPSRLPEDLVLPAADESCMDHVEADRREYEKLLRELKAERGMGTKPPDPPPPPKKYELSQETIDRIRQLTSYVQEPQEPAEEEDAAARAAAKREEERAQREAAARRTIAEFERECGDSR